MYKDPISYRIKTLNSLVKRLADHCFGHKPDRATMMHRWIIAYLQDREDKGLDTFQKDIEVEFSINRSTTSEMLKLMCKKDMIQRVAVSHDARLKKIILTDKSREINEKVEQSMKKMNETLVQGLSQEEVQEFMRLCDKLMDNIKKGVDQD